MIITSRQNPLIVRLAKLRERKHRRGEGLYLAEGVKLAGEAADAGITEYLLITEEHTASRAAEAVERGGGEVITVTHEVLEKISTESAPQGMIAVCRMQPELHETAPDGAELPEITADRLLILDRVRDPGNLGTVLRTAEAFGGIQLLLAGCADIYSPKTVRGSMGAVFRLHTAELPDTATAVRAARAAGLSVLGAALDSTAAELGSAPLPERCAVVIGTEGQGISPEVLGMCDGKLYIPMTGGESLNCSVAAAVIMWEMFRGGIG